MTTAPVKSLIDEMLEEIAGANPADVIRRAERLGYVGWPLKSYREPGGPWVHKYPTPRAEVRP
ncbi:hypothetical protein SAMN04490192_2920 [Pseudomonas lundensis]|uniref:hypothetical protein n=1 Tax=Pseudomonas TaxID=286 RepID=UPI00088012F7|nr:hypothetical protein [Pseudomonas lundensis]SDQ72562.1 hypothetical protein SAMN04490192_2920 [Pseudomonas lundensis]